MTAVPEEGTLPLLRQMDARLDQLLDDTSELKLRMRRIEDGLAGTIGRLEGIDERLARIGVRLERIVDRLSAPRPTTAHRRKPRIDAWRS